MCAGGYQGRVPGKGFSSRGHSAVDTLKDEFRYEPHRMLKRYRGHRELSVPKTKSSGDERSSPKRG